MARSDGPAKGTARERILEEAAHAALSERYGVPKTTMEDVAKAADCSRQTVYKHFPAKADLVTAICVLEAVKLNAEILGFVNRRCGLTSRTTESILVAVRIARENAYIRHLIEPIEIRSRMTDRDDPVFALQRERWMPMLLEARRTGDLATDLNLDEMVTWLTLAQMSLLVQFSQPGCAAELEKMVRRFVVAPLFTKR